MMSSKQLKLAAPTLEEACHAKTRQLAGYNLPKNGYGGMSGEYLFERMGKHPEVIMKTILDVGANDGTLGFEVRSGQVGSGQVGSGQVRSG